MENLFLKNPLQDLLSSLNAVISTNESTQIYNPAYTYKFQLKTTNICISNISSISNIEYQLRYYGQKLVFV